MTVIESLIFGAPDPNVQYCKRRPAYVVVIRNARVAMVSSGQKHFLPGGGSSPPELSDKEVLKLRYNLTSMVDDATAPFERRASCLRRGAVRGVGGLLFSVEPSLVRERQSNSPNPEAG